MVRGLSRREASIRAENGARSPVDVVLPWSVEAVEQSAAGWPPAPLYPDRGHPVAVLSVEIYAPGDKVGEVRSLLVARDGVDHVVVGGPSADGEGVLVTALAVAGMAACVVTVLLRVGGYPPANGVLGDGGLGVLPTVNVATLIVAAVARGARGVAL